ncbi:sugar transferase [Puteibacter caeruleilacunae]|nr:sugar transferase [Puteibacter caeruleilacunae]
MNKKLQTAKYMSADIFAAALSWLFFYIFRKKIIETTVFGIDIPVEFGSQFTLGIVLIPTFWFILYYLTGFYKDIYRRARLLELGQTAFTSIVGTIIIFFALILDDFIASYKDYYYSFFVLLTLQFTITYAFRLILTSKTIRDIHQRKIGFNTFIIGSNDQAIKIYKELTSLKRSTGNIFKGYVSTKSTSQNPLQKHLPQLGIIEDMQTIIDQYDIEEVILAVEQNEHKYIDKILSILGNRNIVVKGTADMHDILSGYVKMTTIFSSPLIKISNGLMPAWQENIKRLFDVSFSLIAIILSLPLTLIVAITIGLTSKGPVIFKQTRIGRYGKPFTMYKFRSMVINAEANGPELSGKNDNRITPIGRFIRKTHIDEIPQFLNVLKGEMSIIGPRPEREYYINLIVQRAPYYTQLHRLRPGITSWGQVKYGYASNVDEMLERLPYEILYIKNISLYLDFKILLYTLINCLRAEGK